MDLVLEIGFRFLPPDEEIINFFLRNKMMGNHDLTGHIREIDLLKQEPWDLPALSIVRSRYREWLFFYRLNQISEGIYYRKTKAGYWKSTGQDRDIKCGGNLIGSKKTLVFYEGRTPRGVKTDWVMHEYRIIPALVPSNTAVTSYVVGLLLNKTADKNETSASYCGHSGNHSAASRSQSIAVRSEQVEAAPRPQSNSMDYELALQTQMEDEGIFECDLPGSIGLSRFLLPSSTGFTDVGLIPMGEEDQGISIAELDRLWSDGDVEYEDDDLQSQFDVEYEDDDLHSQFDDNTMEQEIDFMLSTFPNQNGHSYEEPRYSFLRADRAGDYAVDNELYDQIVRMSGGNGHGHSEGFNQQRMENNVHHDDILIMDSSVDSATITTLQINCVESLREEEYVNSRACKSPHKPKSHNSVVQENPKRVELQFQSSGKSESRDKTRESGVGGAVDELVRNKKSIVQSKKDYKMDRDRNTKRDSNSRSDGSAGSRNKNTFNFVETPQLSCKPEPLLVYLRNVLLGLILVIVVVWEVIFLH